MSNYVLLTGATGLVGRYLLRDLLLRGVNLALVLRPTEKESIQERVEGILQFWENQLGSALPRPVCLEGDVAEANLGLNAEGQKWVAENCDTLIHNAAVLVFYGSDRAGEPWRTNLEGTRHTLAFAQKIGVKNFHYVSTAYVAGCREDLCREDELEVGQKFRNDYEHSKLLAEKLVREATGFEKVTVYRPAVIAGDSVTGYTNTYHGLYAYLKLISLLVRNTEPQADGRRYTPLRLPISGDEPRNIVPVDWVSECMTRLFCNPAAHGGTYQLAPEEDKRLTARDLIEAGYKYFNSYGVEFGEQVQNDAERSNFELNAYSNATKETYEPYEATDPVFDTTNLKRFVPDLPCPEIDEAMIHRFWKYGEDDKWGKRRQPKAKVGFWVSNYIHKQLATKAKASLKANGNGNGNGNRNGHHGNGNGHSNGNGQGKHHPTTVGLRVTGPGGGDWTLQIQDGKLLDAKPGLPSEDVKTLHFVISDFLNLIQGETVTPAGAIADLGETNPDMARQIARALFTADASHALSAAGS